MKRATSSGKKSHVAGDFKRLKAKVGKKAPQKLNSTDTKFSTATVQVQSQSIANKEVSKKHAVLMSSKGKQFSQLMAALNHPSANARSSALNGMKDAITHTPDNLIPQHLSLIIPSLAKCFVDEDSGIRKLTISILFQNVSPRIASCNMAGSMRPFLQLILAYVGSALHSLDQDVRYDGSQALEALCTSYSDLFLEGGDQIEKLQRTIPAFTILFDDVSGGLASMSRRGVGSLSMADTDKEKSKNRPKQTKKGSRAVGVLKSYLAVMKITSFFHHGRNILAEDLAGDSPGRECSDTSVQRCKQDLLPSMSIADLEYVPGGRTSNAIVWKKDQFRYTAVRKMYNLSNLRLEAGVSNKITLSSTSLDVKTQLALFAKLRDRCIEVSQRGQPADKGVYLSPSNAQECILIVNALRLLWNGYISETLRSSQNDDSNLKKLRYTAHSILNLLLECFSIKDTNGSGNNQNLYDSLNASICMALSDFGSILDKLSNNCDMSAQDSQWVRAIFSYVSPQLEDSFDDQDRSTETASNTRVTLIKVVEQLIIPPEKGNESTCLLSEKRYLDLIIRFKASYFSSSNFDDKICKLPEGRKAAALLISLINQYLAGTGGLKSDQLWTNLLEMASLLPNYIMRWRGNFPKDTIIVLSTLLAMSRNCDTMDTSNDKSPHLGSNMLNFFAALRLSLENLFKERKIRLSGNVERISVFEEMPYAAKTMLMSLIGVLRFPSDKLMSCLTIICARRRFVSNTNKSTETSDLNDRIVDYIMIVINSINRTMSLQQYLTFLINSCGINMATYAPESDGGDTKTLCSSNIEFIFLYDKAISRTCRYMLLSKAKNVATSYKPIMKLWLDPSGTEDKTIQFLKARAAISILCCIALSSESIDLDAGNTIFSANDLRVCLGRAIYNLFICLPDDDTNLSEHIGFNDTQRKLVAPILILFRCIAFIFSDFLDSVVKVITASEQDTNDKEKLLQCLATLVRSKDLKNILRNQLSNELQKAIKVIDDHTASGSLHASSGVLTAEVNALLGFN